MSESNVNKILMKNLFWVSFFNYFVAPVTFLTRIIYSHTLAIEDYGLIYAIIGFYSILSLFTDLGFTETLNYYGTKFKEKKDDAKLKLTFYYALMLQGIISLLIALLIIIFYDKIAVAYFNTAAAGSVLLILLIYFIFTNLSKPLFTLFVVEQNFFYNKLFNFSKFFLIFLMSLPLLFWDHLTIDFVAWVWGISLLVMTVVYYFLIRKKFKSILSKNKFYFDKVLFKKLLAYAFPLAFSVGGVFLLGRIDVQMIAMLGTLTEVAYYETGLALANILYLLVGIVIPVIFPFTTKLIANKNKKELGKVISNVYRYVFILGIPVLVYFMIFSYEILYYLFGKIFVGGESVFQILCFAIFMSVLASFNLNILSGFGEAKLKAFIVYVILIFNIIGNYVALFIYGYIGVAYVTLIGFALMFLLTMYNVKKRVKFDFSVMKFLYLIALNVFIFLLGSWLKVYLNLNPFYEIIDILAITGIVYIVLARLLNLYNFKEITDLISKRKSN